MIMIIIREEKIIHLLNKQSFWYNFLALVGV